jgi:hypothetical protein
MRKNTAIQRISSAEKVPPQDITNWSDISVRGRPDAQAHIGLVGVDVEFLAAIGAEMIAGRNFSREYGTDPETAVILNNSALHTPKSKLEASCSKTTSKSHSEPCCGKKSTRPSTFPAWPPAWRALS